MPPQTFPSTLPDSIPHLQKPSRPQPERRTFTTLQAGRGIAAVMVVLYHIGNFVGDDVALWHKTFVYRIFYAGIYGVDFFFILSGIVMISAHWNDFGQPQRVPRFFWKRFRRIYPIYWLFLVPTVLKQLRITGSHGLAQRNPFVILSSFLLIHIRSLGVNLVVSWTLFHEVLFYAFFATLVINKRLGIILGTVWFGTSFFFMTPQAFAVEPNNYAQMLFSPLHLLFFFGMIAGWTLQSRRGPTHLAVLATGLALFFICVALQASRQSVFPVIRILGDAGLALALVALAQREYLFSLRVPPFLLLLGDASYSLYLSHFMVVWALAGIGFKLDPHLRLTTWIWVAILFITALGVGIAAHQWIERPLLRLFGDRRASTMRVEAILTQASTKLL